MRRLILGTAGHIDHGKTALVKALTGVDTDRLKEEKERGITVDLGFAEYQAGEGVRFGVVDVPGHEGFIRNMVAGATGMDLVLLVVAADEGVMPQTREHLAIIRLLGVPRLAVAITKSDLVEEGWTELVEEEIRELLRGTPYAEAPILPVSSRTGEGLEALGLVLARLGEDASEAVLDDLARLPVDRVFTIRGTGTVVTGTLWSGTLRKGQGVRILPGDVDARIRSLQIHGEDASQARAGARVALALSGSKAGHEDLTRGQTIVGEGAWETSWMLTCRITLLSGTGWEMEQGQRVRVHHGTAETLARVALLETDRLEGGTEGWVQLRLEGPLLARVRDHLVVRSYSPVTTIGGGTVVEVAPRKRRRLASDEDALLTTRLLGAPSEVLLALFTMAGWDGVPVAALPQRTGLSPSRIEEPLAALVREEGVVEVEGRLFSREVGAKGRSEILSRLEAFHGSHPLRPGMPLEELRQSLPGEFGTELSEALLRALMADGKVAVDMGTARLASYRTTLSKRQAALKRQLEKTLEEAGLAPPNLRELGEAFGNQDEVEAILRIMADEETVLAMDPEFFFRRTTVDQAGLSVINALGGAQNLGPADFREVLPVSRRHLLPLLRYFDLVGVTTRIGEGREVAEEPPPGWGTKSGMEQYDR